MTISVYQQGGYGTAPLFPDPIIAPRDPTTNDKVSPTGAPYQVLQGWNNNLTDDTFIYLGAGNWIKISSIVGTVTQLTGDSGTALPVAGSIQIAGGTNITTVAAGAVVTVNLDATLAGLTSVSSATFLTSSATLGVTWTANSFTATGSNAAIDISLVPKGAGVVAVTGALTTTTTVTAGTGVTATTGNIVATAGAVNAGTTMTAGTGITATTGNIVATAGAVNAGTSITATLGDITATNGNIVRGTAGNKDVYTSVATTTAAGANSAGTVTLTGGTATVSTTAVTANSIIRLYRQGIGATGAAALGILTLGTVTPATSFVINAVQAADATALQATDVSSIGWEIVN